MAQWSYMSSIASLETPATRLINHEEFLQNKSNAIDEFVAYAHMHREDSWGPADAPYMRWEEVCSNLIDKHAQLELPLVGSRAPSSESVDIAEEILVNGSHAGHRIDTPLLHIRAGGYNHLWPDGGDARGIANQAYIRRIVFAHLALYARDTFDALQTHEIIAFHGTRGYALPSIVTQSGLYSHQRLAEDKAVIGSGELHLGGIRRRFISFDESPGDRAISYMNKDIRRDNAEYIEETKDEYEGSRLRYQELVDFEQWIKKEKQHNRFLDHADRLRFGIMFGLARSALMQAGLDDSVGRRVSVIDADVDELAFADHVSLSHLPVIMVDDDSHEYVQNYLDTAQQKQHLKLIPLTGLKRAITYAQRVRYSL